MGNLVPNAMSGLDMETGSFTPVLINRINGSIESYTATVATGKYVKLGKLVFVAVEITGISGLRTDGNTATRAGIGGLPFSAACTGSCTIGAVYNIFTKLDESDDVMAIISAGYRMISFMHSKGGNSAQFSALGSNAGVILSGVYITDDVTPAGGVIFVALPDIFSERRWAA